jgi:hypothetical protein
MDTVWDAVSRSWTFSINFEFIPSEYPTIHGLNDNDDVEYVDGEVGDVDVPPPYTGEPDRGTPDRIGESVPRKLTEIDLKWK